MNVSSVKNLNGETFSAVQDADLTTVVQTNSGEWDRISALSGYSANGWRFKPTHNHVVFAGSSLFTRISAGGTTTAYFGVYGTASKDPYFYISNGQIWLYNQNRSLSAQTIRPNDIVKWNDYDKNKLNVSDFNIPESATWNETSTTVQTNSSNWNEISAYQNASATYLTAINIPESADWEDTTEVVQSNSASWSSTPTYAYTDNNLIYTIDTSGLYAISAGTAQSLINGGRLGTDVYAITGAGTNSMTLMILNPNTTPFGNTSGIYGPLRYAQGACMTYGSSAGNTQYFGGFFKGNEWYVSNATAGQALRGETHLSRGVHLSGVTTDGYSFDLGIHCVSGKNNTAGYNWKLERGCVSGKGTTGEWRYGPAEDTALRTVSALEYNAVDEISGIAGSAIAQYGAEKQWLVHDDTLVHAANSAQYALGVNVTAVQTLMNVSEVSACMKIVNNTVTGNAGSINRIVSNVIADIPDGWKFMCWCSFHTNGWVAAVDAGSPMVSATDIWGIYAASNYSNTANCRINCVYLIKKKLPGEA